VSATRKTGLTTSLLDRKVKAKYPWLFPGASGKETHQSPLPTAAAFIRAAWVDEGAVIVLIEHETSGESKAVALDHLTLVAPEAGK
jgi:hypothetical protein